MLVFYYSHLNIFSLSVEIPDNLSPIKNQVSVPTSAQPGDGNGGIDALILIPSSPADEEMKVPPPCWAADEAVPSFDLLHETPEANAPGPSEEIALEGENFKGKGLEEEPAGVNTPVGESSAKNTTEGEPSSQPQREKRMVEFSYDNSAEDPGVARKLTELSILPKDWQTYDSLDWNDSFNLFVKNMALV